MSVLHHSARGVLFYCKASCDLRIDSDILNFSVQQKDKEDLEEVSTELELADEDQLIPYVDDRTTTRYNPSD